MITYMDLEEEVLQAQPTQEELDDFKAKVSEWTKLDEQIKKLNIAIRERKVHQKVLSNGIQTFMNKFGYGNLNTNQGRIVYTVRKCKQPIKISEVKRILQERDETLAKELFEGDRPVVEKQSIRRIVPRVSMNLEI